MTGPNRATGPDPDQPEVEIQPEGDPALPQQPEPGPEVDPEEEQDEPGADEPDAEDGEE